MSIVERALAKAAALGGRKEDGPRSVRPANRRPAARGAGVHETTRSSTPTIDLDPDRLRASGLMPPADMDHVLAEELRVIKRPLLLNAERPDLPNGNLLMIAGALPGAGKTFMSFNVAMSMADELDWSVLLVDADVSRPTLSRHLGLGDAPGLIDLLEDEGGTVADYACNTSQPRLQFLPAGPLRAHSKEYLASQRMRSLVADLGAMRERRIVLFDSPPLLLTSEARVLASYVGQVALVVEAGATPRTSVHEAVELLDPAKAINLVLNKSRRLFGITDYGYYSGYAAYGRDSAT